MASQNQLRLRNHGTIKELNIPSEILDVLHKTESSNIAISTKKQIVRKLTNGSPCCVCGSIPSLEIHYPVIDGGATKVERYCEPCASKVYAREQVL